MILVISSHITNRFEYVLNFIKDCYPNLVFKWANSIGELDPTEGTILVEYNVKQTINDAIFIGACGLLKEDGIKPIDPTWDEDLEVPKAFVNQSFLGYDLFASIFFQLTRYEEYIPTELDSYGRFNSANALHVKANSAISPMVDLQIQAFFKSIAKQQPDFQFSCPIGDSMATMDIDIAYDYLGRGLMRTAGAFVRNIFRPKGLLERIAVLLRLKKDPAYIFPKLADLDVHYFIHVGDYGPLDKSCGLSRKEYQAFLQKLPSKQIGLHPSFQSHLNIDELLYEMEQLETVADQSISTSRQHFIKMILPDTYELLEQIGIKQEYSMGWPDRPGYRAGTTKKHRFFNLRTNHETDLELVPFCWMDTHFLFGNRKENMEELFVKFQLEHQKLGGRFRPIFHNNHFKTNPVLWELIKKA